jgi:hypothetical protein
MQPFKISIKILMLQRSHHLKHFIIQNYYFNIIILINDDVLFDNF